MIHNNIQFMKVLMIHNNIRVMIWEIVLLIHDMNHELISMNTETINRWIKTFLLLYSYLNTFTESRTSQLCQMDDKIIVQLSESQGLLWTVVQ